VPSQPGTGPPRTPDTGPPAGNGPGQTPTRNAQDTGSCSFQHHPQRVTREHRSDTDHPCIKRYARLRTLRAPRSWSHCVVGASSVSAASTTRQVNQEYVLPVIRMNHRHGRAQRPWPPQDLDRPLGSHPRSRSHGYDQPGQATLCRAGFGPPGRSARGWSRTWVGQPPGARAG